MNLHTLLVSEMNANIMKIWLEVVCTSHFGVGQKKNLNKTFSISSLFSQIMDSKWHLRFVFLWSTALVSGVVPLNLLSIFLTESSLKLSVSSTIQTSLIL